jgi:transglutaminase-like putative cysteine protease
MESTCHLDTYLELESFLLSTMARFNSFQNPESFRGLTGKDQYAFIINLMTRIRIEIPFGADPKNVYPPPSLWLRMKYPAACGGYCYLFHFLLKRIGLESRFVYCSTRDSIGHCSIEVLLPSGYWFLDPLTLFPGTLNSEPKPLEFWLNNLGIIRSWEENFSIHFMRYDQRLSDFLWKTSNEEISGVV